MATLPPILDIRDDLERAREDDPSIADELDDAAERLSAFAERDRASRDTVLDELENQLLSVQERTDGEASRRLEAARNRIATYRDARESSAEGVTVVETTLRGGEEDAVPDDTAKVWGQTVTVEALVTNDGDARPVRPEVTFHDDENRTLDTVTGDEVRLDAGAERRLGLEVTVPDGTTYYAVRVLPLSD